MLSLRFFNSTLLFVQFGLLKVEKEKWGPTSHVCGPTTLIGPMTGGGVIYLI